jgi:hypothetical protein
MEYMQPAQQGDHEHNYSTPGIREEQYTLTRQAVGSDATQEQEGESRQHFRHDHQPHSRGGTC